MRKIFQSRFDGASVKRNSISNTREQEMLQKEKNKENKRNRGRIYRGYNNPKSEKKYIRWNIRERAVIKLYTYI